MKTDENTYAAIRQELIRRFSYENIHFGMVPSSAIAKNHQVVDSILKTDAFVQRVFSNDEPIWELPKTSTAYLPATLTSLGDSFYGLHDHPMINLDTGMFEPGANLKLYNLVAGEMERHSARLTCNPMAQPYAQAPLEGEFVNSFAEHIRRQGRKSQFIEAKKAREKSAKAQLRPAQQLLKSLSGRVKAVFGQWINLEYQYSDTSPGTANRAISNAHLNIFRDSLQDKAYLLHSIGQIWTRHYLPETGLRVRMLMLTSEWPSANHWENLLGPLWATATSGAGKYTAEPNLLGIGEIEHALKVHALCEMLVRSATQTTEDFGCFDSSSMSLYGLNPPQSTSVI